MKKKLFMKIIVTKNNKGFYTAKSQPSFLFNFQSFKCWVGFQICKGFAQVVSDSLDLLPTCTCLFAFTFSGCQFQFLFLSCFGSGTPLFICLPVCCDTTYGSSSELLVMRVNYNFKWKKPLTISMMQLGSTFCFFGKWKRGWKPDREGVRWMDCM